MIKETNLPNNIAVFPLANAVFFPRTILPLNIFEERYIQLVNDSMKSERMFGMVQPKNIKNNTPEVYRVGCLGKIISFNETLDKRFIINLSGIIRFRIKNELNKEKLYRKFSVDYSEFLNDLNEKNQTTNFDKNSFFKKIKIFFKKIRYQVNHDELEKLNLDQLISTVCMISPFTIEEKQKMMETVKIEDKIEILNDIINFKLFEYQENKTLQ